MFAIPNPALFPSLLLAFVPNVRAPRQNRTRTDSTGTQETFGFHMSNISYIAALTEVLRESIKIAMRTLI